MRFLSTLLLSALTTLLTIGCASSGSRSTASSDTDSRGFKYNLTEKDFGGLENAIKVFGVDRDIARMEKGAKEKVQVLAIRASMVDQQYCRYEFQADIAPFNREGRHDRLSSYTNMVGGEAHVQGCNNSN